MKFGGVVSGASLVQKTRSLGETVSKKGCNQVTAIFGLSKTILCHSNWTNTNNDQIPNVILQENLC